MKSFWFGPPQTTTLKHGTARPASISNLTWMYGQMVAWIDECRHGWTNKRMDEWMDQWMDGCIDR